MIHKMRRSAFCQEEPNKSQVSAILEENGCMFLFPQSDDISGGLPQRIGFGEGEIYICVKVYF